MNGRYVNIEWLDDEMNGLLVRYNVEMPVYA